MTRRAFGRTVAGIGAGLASAGGLLPSILTPSMARAEARAAMAKDSGAETAVKRFYDTLTDEQKKSICFPFDHELRKKINANWSITKPTIGSDFYKEDQRKVLDEVFRGITSPDGYERFIKQMDDDSGGFSEYTVAVFGTPGTGQFEWELTGRHLTARADGDSVSGAAFGGPIVYGHGAGDGEKGLPGNVFYYQTQKANEVFKALDGTQRKSALLSKAPKEDAVKVQGADGSYSGLRVGDMSSDQKELVESVMKVLLAPYRESDAEEAMAILKEGGGVDALRMAFYETEDLGGDHEWDLWRLEAPNFVWHFRGAPHVHCYVNIAKKA